MIFLLENNFSNMMKILLFVVIFLLKQKHFMSVSLVWEMKQTKK